MGKYQPFHDLDDETNDALRQSIARFGVVSPVVVDGNGSIIDGHQRARIAGELGLTYPILKRAVKNEDDAIALAYSLNADRRQLTVEQRRDIVADLRSKGYSLRAIAGVTKTSLGTAHNDVKQSGVQVEHVEGGDGRTYPASKPATEDAPDGVDPETGEIAAAGDEEHGNDDNGTLTPDASPTPAPAPPGPPETKAERDAREAEQRRVDRNVAFGKHLIGLWALLGDGGKPIRALLDGWVPEESPAWLVEAHRPVFTADGIRSVAVLLEKLATEWESRV